MSHHFEDWQFAHLGIGNRRSDVKHRIKTHPKVERIDYDHWKTLRKGRTACGVPIKSVYELSPTEPNLSPWECFITGWRPCLRCFPGFEMFVLNRLRREDQEAIEKANGDTESPIYTEVYNRHWREIEVQRIAKV